MTESLAVSGFQANFCITYQTRQGVKIVQSVTQNAFIPAPMVRIFNWISSDLSLNHFNGLDRRKRQSKLRITLS